MLLHEIVHLAASANPDGLALVGDGRRVTFAQLEARVAHMAAQLEPLTAPGERVALVSDNTLDAIVALYAVPHTGASLAPANTRHTPAEIGRILSSTAPSVVLGTPEQLDRVADLLDDLDKPPRVFSLGGTHERAEANLTALLDEAGTRDEPGHQHVAADPRVCAWIIHTSGTTGQPKGAMLTHSSLVAAVLNTAIARPIADDDTYLFPFPLFHVAAYNVLHAHLRRRPVVLVPRFDAAVVADAIRAEGVTCCSLAPTMISMLLDHLEETGETLHDLRQISYGASPMSIALLQRIFDVLPEVGLAQGYGMTELSGNAVFLGPDDHRRAFRDAPHLLRAAGRPGPLAAIRIENASGEEVPRGEIGEILVRGNQVAPGYWNDPVATAECRSGHWLRTGDVGRIDDEGYLYVIDREKDIIVTGGENVASREVEDALLAHPQVAQVAVVGVDDDKWGEAVCAVVVPAEGEAVDPDEIVEWSRGRLAGYKRPKRVVTLDELPVNASGKVDKRRVRELVEAIDLRREPVEDPLSAVPGP